MENGQKGRKGVGQEQKGKGVQWVGKGLKRGIFKRENKKDSMVVGAKQEIERD